MAIRFTDFTIEAGFLHHHEYNPINLVNMVNVQLINNTLYLYDNEGNLHDLSGTPDDLQSAYVKLEAYIKNNIIFNIFKELQKSNPMLSPKETWTLAEETHALLVTKKILIKY